MIDPYPHNPIRVLIVDDSPSAAQFIFFILSSDPALKVVGTAYSGEEAIKSVAGLQPDVVTMDINMPGMDGFETTRRIMAATPVPIVIVSSIYSHTDAAKAFDAMSAGALAILPKPVGLKHPSHQENADELITTIKLMAEVKVVTHRKVSGSEKKEAIVNLASTAKPDIKVIAIGASTGGPPVIQTILSRLTKPLPVPVFIVQHITKGFTQNFADWLGMSTGFNVLVPIHGQAVDPGTVYIAPDDFHMGVNSRGLIVLSSGPPENNLRPAVSHLFRSVAVAFAEHGLGIILSGMGKDGAEELRQLKACGSITIAQNKDSSIVHGMPGEAISLHAATYILSPAEIAEKINELLNFKG